MSTGSIYALTAMSRNMKEATLKTRRLYRQSMRELPTLVRSYQLELTVSEARNKVKSDFLKNKHISEPYLVDALVFKGTSDLEEARLLHMTKAHVMRYFTPEPSTIVDHEESYQSPELDDFFNPK